MTHDGRTIRRGADGGAGDSGLELRAGERVEWVQPRRFHRGWELRRRGVVVGRIEPAHWWGGSLRATLGTRVWHFKERWLTRVELRREGAETPYATYRPGFLGRGAIHVAGGDRLEWRFAGMLGLVARAHEIRTESDAMLVRFEHGRGFFKAEGTAQVSDAGARRADADVLLLLGVGLALFAAAHQAHAAGGH